jgi:hypothetical protein
MKEITINRSENQVALSMNKAFYTKKAVILASQAFCESCFISIDADSASYSVIIKPKEETDLEVLGREFFNYALEIMQNE